MEIQRIRHASFRIATDSGLQLYFDPWELPVGLPTADIVAISHDHYDHCSPADIRKILGSSTVLVGPPAVQSRLSREGWTVSILRPGGTVTAKGVRLRGVEAYNVNKFRPTGEPFHPREKGYLGFVAELDGARVYFAGDTDIIPPDVERDGPVDVALVPVSGTYVMTASEAASQLTGRPFRYAVPMHYGAIAGSAKDAEEFKGAASCRVIVLGDGESWRWPGNGRRH